MHCNNDNKPYTTSLCVVYTFYSSEMLLDIIPLGNTAISHIASALTENVNLEMLLIAENPFGNEGGLSLAAALCEHHTPLRILDIQKTRMSPEVEKQVCICMCV